MLYLGIDLHRKQMTVSLRNEDGDVVLRRQVSTRWPKLEEFRANCSKPWLPTRSTWRSSRSADFTTGW